MRGASDLLVAICVLLPLLVSAWRDESDVYMSSRHSATRTSLHVRVDGKQMKLKPSSVSPGAEGTVAPAGASAGATTGGPETPAQVSKGDDAEDHDELRVKSNRSLWKSLDPRGSPVMFLFWALIVAAVAIPIVALFRRLCGSSVSLETPEKKKGQGIHAGTVLVCTCTDTEESAKVYAKMGSHEVIQHVEPAKTVTVAGPGKMIAGHMMVPIEPDGAVHLTDFREEKALWIQPGTILTCKNIEGADVFREANSDYMLGQIDEGERVVASGPSQWCHGWTMIPVRPRGAVELEFFEVHEGEWSTDEAATSAWAKAETEGDAETIEKLRKLKGEKTKILLEQAMRKRKLEQIIEEMLAQEADLAGKERPTDEDIKKSAEQALANADISAKRSMFMAVAYAAPLVTQSQKIYSAVEEAVQKTRERAANMALEGSKDALKQLQGAFGLEDLDTLDFNAINIPSIASILACVFAPTQLRFVYSINLLFLAMSVANVIMDFSVIAFDWHTPCMCIPAPEPPPGAGFKAWFHMWLEDSQNDRMYMWYIVDCCVHLFCLTARIPVFRRVGTMLQHLVPPPDMENEPDPIKALKSYYEFYSSTGSYALVELDVALSSAWLYMANWSVFFDCCWLLYGTDLVWNTPWSVCKSSGLIILRLRITLFQILFILYMLQLIFFVTGQLMQGDAFNVRILEAADKYDKFLGMGIPVTKVVCHAFTVRHSSDMLTIQLSIQKAERERWKEKKDAAEAKLKEINDSYDAADHAIEKLEHEKAAVGDLWKDEAELQAQLEEAQNKIKKDSEEFAKQLNERSVKATEQAEALLDQWERGEGGELIQAFAQGEGLTKAGEMLSEISATEMLDKIGGKVGQHDLVQAGLAQAQTAADNAQLISELGGIPREESIASQSPAVPPATGVTGAEDAAGGSPIDAATAAAPPAVVAKAAMPVAPQRPSQADEGAGGPSISEAQPGDNNTGFL